METDRPKNGSTREKTFPVMEEELQVGKRTVEKGTTRVRKEVHTAEQTVEAPLLSESVDVQRVAVNRMIDEPVATRTDGNVTIIPVMEEVLVVEKKLRLKEEIHIRQRREIVPHRQKEVVRKEEVVVEHETEH